MNDFREALNVFRKDPKIGLALSSGSSRGIAHIGVLKAIIDKGIPIDMVSGASAGAIVGAYFASRGNVDGLEEAVQNAAPKQMFDMMSLDLAFKLKGFIGQKKSLNWLKGLLGGLYFSDMKMPLAIISTDMNSGEEVVITKGSVLEAVRASISMPVLFTPIKSQGRYLVDGCFSNPLPVDAVKKMGATFVIASNVIWTPKIAKEELARRGDAVRSGISNIVLSDELERAKDELLKNVTRESKKRPAGEGNDIPNMFNVLINSIYTMQFAFVKSKMRQADITISPDLSGISMLDFFHGKDTIDKGYEAAIKRFSRLIKRLSPKPGQGTPTQTNK